MMQKQSSGRVQVGVALPEHVSLHYAALFSYSWAPKLPPLEA